MSLFSVEVGWYNGGVEVVWVLYTEMTVKAMKIAYEAHHGQVDKAGVPYVLHPVHLAEQMADEVSTCVALLHDVVEDTQWTIEELAAEFPQEVVDALRLLTHEEGVPYMEYVAAIADNATATRVKLEDLKHNMDPTRMCGNPAMMGRVSPEKAELYRQAWDYLSGRL